MLSTNLQELYQRNQFSKIIDTWEELEVSSKQDPQSTYIVAATYFQLGDFEKCSSLCSSVDGFYVNDANFLSMYAACLRRQGLLSQSEKCFLSAIELDPNSIHLQNNYSNLLIDQGNYTKAKEILKSILKSNPLYEDAKANMTRVQSLINSQMINSKGDDINSNSSPFNFKDPIMDAFELHEVIKCGALHEVDVIDKYDLVGTINNKDLEEAEHELLKLAQSQVSSKQYHGALNSISKVIERKGIVASAYQIATEVYIGLKDFKRAEVMAIQAFVFGLSNVNLFINLGNLAAMRKDFNSCKYWLDKASEIDPDDVNLKKSINMLFPNGHPRDKNQPFV